MSDSYRQALQDAMRELIALSKQRSEIDRRIARLTQSISALSVLCGNEPQRLSDSTGLTDTIRVVLQAANEPLTPPEIKDKIEMIGYQWPNPANALQSIHSVLKRLNVGGEVQEITGWTAKPGRTCYRWIPQIIGTPPPPPRFPILEAAADLASLRNEITSASLKSLRELGRKK